MKALNEAIGRPSVQMPKMTNAVSDKFGQLGQWASNQGAQWQGYGQYITNTDFGQKVLVMNPMHMVQLSSKTKSRMVKIVEFCRSASEKWFSHWLLLVVLIMYALIGAWIFVMIEGSAEIDVKVSNEFTSVTPAKVISFLHLASGSCHRRQREDQERHLVLHSHQQSFTITTGRNHR